MKASLRANTSVSCVLRITTYSCLTQPERIFIDMEAHDGILHKGKELKRCSIAHSKQTTRQQWAAYEYYETARMTEAHVDGIMNDAKKQKNGAPERLALRRGTPRI